MTAATWSTVHAGDTVLGADGGRWAVVERATGPHWVGSGRQTSMFTMRHGERTVTAAMVLTDPAAVVDRADHTDTANAVQAALDAGLTVQVIREGAMSDETVEQPPCEHPAERLSRLKSGKVKCTACKTYVNVAPPEPVAPATVDVPGALPATPAPDGGSGGGALVTGPSSTPNPDPFDAPAPLGKRAEAPRGQWGWYKLGHPVTGEADKLWPRVTTIAKTLADEYGLTQWKLRMAVKGVALRPDLIARAAAADVETDKGVLDSVVKSAHERAESGAAANWGSALHKFAERMDAGESIASMGVPTSLVGDLEGYARTLKRNGLEVLPEYSERTVVNVACEYAGTWDRIVRDRAGNLYVLDLKSGQDLSYAWLEIAIQEAMYAHATHMCSVDFTSYDPFPAVDKMKALVLHLPLGSGKGEIYGVPIDKGWHAAETAMHVRRMRSESKSWNWLVQPEDPAAVVRLHLDRCETLPALMDVVSAAKRTGRWTAELEPYALGRYDLIRAASAQTRGELAALWEELTPAGRWTEAVAEAAQYRATALAAA